MLSGDLHVSYGFRTFEKKTEVVLWMAKISTKKEINIAKFIIIIKWITKLTSNVVLCV